MNATASLKLSLIRRHTIRPLWSPMPRVAGPAFTVRTARHDNPGDVVVAGEEGIVGYRRHRAAL